MIKNKYKTSRLLDPECKEGVEIRSAQRPSRVRILYIYFLFGRMLLLIGLRKVTGRLNDQQKARLLREVVETLGGLWIKLAQFVAMRTDMYSKDFCNELSKLQDRAFGFPADMVVKTIEKELGKPVEEVFAQFNRVPIAAASLAQVHRARLRFDDRWVAVKVQKPHSEEYLRGDMVIIRRWFKLLTWLGISRYLSLEEMGWEMNQVFQEELDFRLEAVNLRRFRRIVKRHGVLVPKVYKRYCTKRMVVMEYVEGVTMTEYIKVQRTNSEALKAWRKTNRIKPKKVASKLITSVLRQLFEENFFHGDLHPGNIMLLRKNRVALIDLGSVGSTDAHSLSLYEQYIQASGKRQYKKAAELLLMTSPSVRNMDLTPVVREISKALRAAEARAALTEISREERVSVFSDTQDELNRTFRKFQLKPDWSFLKFGRAMGTLEHTLVYLDSKMNFNKTYGKYFVTAKKRSDALLNKQMGDLPRTIANNGALWLSQLRQRSLPYTVTMDKMTSIVGGVLKGVRLLTWGGFAVALWTFLYQHYREVVEWAHTSDTLLTRRIEALPRIGEWAFFFLLVFAFLVCRKFSRWVADFNEPFARR